MKKILITGALGHIGSRFIHSIKPGHFEQVVLLDNLSSQRYASLFNLPVGARFVFVEDDICTADLKRYFDGMDVIVHLAAITDAAGSIKAVNEVMKVNFQGTERVARACIDCNCRLIFPSSTSVYGTQKDLVDEHCPIDELKPQSPYADSKLVSEQLLNLLGKNEGLQFIILRLGTIFGTSVGMRFHTAVNKFCWQAVMGQPLTVWRSAYNQVRPYLDVADAVSALKFIIDNDIFDNDIYNVLTLNASVKDIIDTISRFVSDTAISYVDAEIMNQLSYHVSCDYFKSRGFTFAGDLVKGIGETVGLLEGCRQDFAR